MVNQTTSFSTDADTLKAFKEKVKALSVKQGKRFLVRDCFNEAMRDWITKNTEVI